MTILIPSVSLMKVKALTIFQFERASMMNKKIQKKSGDELQGFLMWRNRGSVVPAKKGKGSYKRKSKHKNKCGYDV